MGRRWRICKVTRGGQQDTVEREVALVGDWGQQQARIQAATYEQGEGEAVGPTSHVDAAASRGGPVISPCIC